MLAKHYGYDFIDLDQYLEKKAGKAIPEIFSEQGEKAFRELEAAALRTIIQEKVVVATGGGTPCFQDNLAWMNEQGISIFIDVPLPLIIERLLKRPSSRPLLKDVSMKDLPDFVESLLAARRSFYQQAQYQLRSTRKEQTVQDLISLLKIGAKL